MSKKKSLIISILMFLVLLTHGSFVYSASPWILTKPLKDISAISVSVNKLDPDIENKRGLTREQIRTDIELRLKKAGIKVVSRDESFKLRGSPYLYVTLHTFYNSVFPGAVAFNIRISLNQNVWLERNPGEIVFGADTYWEEYLGLVGEENIASIRDRIIDLVDEFIIDYLSVNPRWEK